MNFSPSGIYRNGTWSERLQRPRKKPGPKPGQAARQGGRNKEIIKGKPTPLTMGKIVLFLWGTP